jgi:hypothetical protein
MKARQPVDLHSLRRDFDVAAAYFALDVPARGLAWIAALSQPVHAARCYRAIAQSLRIPVPRARQRFFTVALY